MCNVIVAADDPRRVIDLQTSLITRGHHVTVADRQPIEMLLAHVVALLPATLVLQGSMSGTDLRSIARATENEPRLSVLFAGSTRRHLEELVALASGITGYLPAESPPEVIADTVNALDAGAILLPRDALLPVAAEPHHHSYRVTLDERQERTVDLTHREREILVLLRQDYTTAEIARRLVVAPVTVRTHIATLLHKLGLHDRRSLTLDGEQERHGG